ncbi:aquaporin Z [Rhizobium leguminosarum]
MVVPTRLAMRTRAGELTCALFEAGVGDAEIASVIFNPISIFMNRLGRPAGLNAISGLRKRLLAPQVPHASPPASRSLREACRGNVRALDRNRIVTDSLKLLVEVKEARMQKSLVAEFLGTFWLVFGGCGSAVLAAAYPELGIGFVGVAFAFGLTVLTMAYAVGGISGGHFNPAVSLGLTVAGRFPAARLVPYVVAQVVGAIAAAALLYLIASGKAGFELGGFAANGYGDHSPGGYSLLSALLIEVLLTMFFLIIILGSTSSRVPAGFAPLAIGLGLTLIHLVSIPVTNTSVNPARSTGQALFVGGWALQQLWLFWIAPLAGGALGGLVWKFLDDAD